MACGDYQIQRAHLFDARRIVRLEREIFPKDAYSTFEIALLMFSPGVRNYKLLAPGGELAGFISGSRETFFQPAWIITIGIGMVYQRQGLGHCLLGWFEQKINAKRIRLSVRASNTPAIALYRQTGYQHIERHQGFYSDGEDGLVMEKRIEHS